MQYQIVRASSMVLTKFEAVPQEDANFCSLDPKVEIPLTYSLSSCGIFCSTQSNFGQCSAYMVDKEERTCECGIAACSDANGGNTNQSVHVHVECIRKFVSSINRVDCWGLQKYFYLVLIKA